MRHKRELVVRGRYAISTFNNRIVLIESLIDGDCDYPVLYANNEVRYNYPERWPKYFKDKVRKWMIKWRNHA